MKQREKAKELGREGLRGQRTDVRKSKERGAKGRQQTFNVQRSTFNVQLKKTEDGGQRDPAKLRVIGYWLSVIGTQRCGFSVICY
jgi:hypothetical protein